MSRKIKHPFIYGMKAIRKSRGSMFRRLFIQITSTVLFCFIVSNFLLIFFFARFWKTDIYRELDKHVSGIVSVISRSSEKTGAVDIIDALLSISYTSSGEAYLVDADGHIAVCVDMLDSEGSFTGQCPVHSALSFPSEMMTELASAGEDYHAEHTLLDFGGGSWFISGHRVTVNGDGIYIVVMENSESAYIPYTTDFLRMILSTGLIAVLISFFASVAVSYRMSKPIKKVTSATVQYAAGDFTVKIPEMHTYDELESLIDSVNSMADSLSVLEESRSNFIANVSHELKTPMTIISGFIDGILDGTIDGGEREKYLNIVSDEVKRLSRLVVAMLNMSKIEAGKLTLKPVSVNMKKLIFSVLVSFEKVIEAKNIDISGLDSLENVVFDADDALINQVVYNLVDNAVKFTPRDGTISFALYEEKKTANIIIRNSGDGIPTEETALVFDRFYKVDKSRRLDSQSFGMGLYIVKNIIELHGGSVSIGGDQGEYTEFHIRLPM